VTEPTDDGAVRGRHAGEPADERVIEHDAYEPAVLGLSHEAPAPAVTHTPMPAGMPVMPAGMAAAPHILPTGLDGAPISLRRQRREERRRRDRRNRYVGIAVVLVLALVAGAITYAAGSRHHHAAAAPGRGQQTLLLGIGDPDSGASSVALLGVDRAGNASVLLVPQSTIVDGPGGTVGGSYPIAPSGEFAGAVSDLLGVQIDATWRLSPAGLSALVTQIGGITLTVDEAVSSGSLQLNTGPQTLNGPQAAAFATYLGSDTETERANRLSLVLGGILTKLPAQGALTPLIGSLAQNSSSTWTPTQLAQFLTGLKADTAAGNESQQVLPVTALDTGADEPTYTIDPKAGPPAVASLFGESLLPDHGAPGTRVEIINDSGRPGLTTEVRAQLSAHGLTFVRAINDSPFHQYKQTSVLVFDSTSASIALGHRVAAALGLPNAPVLVSNQSTSVADAIAVLADDYGG
jgi:anionic cell wall polymer biosynthesis LytR-Cps2A-Psr (LCP) family protein